MPHQQFPGKPVLATVQVDIGVSGKGIRLAAKARCQRKVKEIWCQRTYNPGCTTPPTFRQEDVDCPPGVQGSVHSPWGQSFSARFDATGIAEVPIDWATTGIDPLAVGATERLAAGWVLRGEAIRDVPLKIAPADAERMRSVIGAATDTQYEVGAVNEKATLSTEITAGELAAGQPGSLTLTITNGGPQPAYRVIAKLQSSVAALHGCQISFGRIDPGRTKVRKQVIALPPGQDDRSALVVAQVSYFNGDPLEARRRFDIKPGPPGSARPPVTAAAGTRVEPPRTATGGNQVELPRGLTVACKLAAAEVGPGERVRLECELRNLGSEPLAQVGLKVSVGGVDSENQAPKSLPGAGSVKLELVGLAAQKVKQGDKLPVIVRATAQGVPRAEQILSVAIGSQATRCKARLTRDEYKVKQKRLQAALDSGSLTQKELDKYEAELVSCLQ